MENDVAAAALHLVAIHADAPSYCVGPFAAAKVAIVMGSPALAPKPHGKRIGARSSYLFVATVVSF